MVPLCDSRKELKRRKSKWKIQVWEEICNFCTRFEFPEFKKPLKERIKVLNEQYFLIEKLSKNLYANGHGGNCIFGWAVESCVFVFGHESCGTETPKLDMELGSLWLFARWHRGGYTA